MSVLFGSFYSLFFFLFFFLQEEVAANLFTDILGDLMPPLFEEDLPLPSPESLKFKIVLKV